jgi:hypothetical protein
MVLMRVVPAGAVDEFEEAPRLLLWHCHDSDLDDTGFPGCEVTLEALKVEIGGSSLAVIPVSTHSAFPPDPRAMAMQGGAIFVAWVAPRTGGAGYVIYAYDALNAQILSKEVVVEKGHEAPDAEAVAFLYRNMLGTSLFTDLETIEQDVDLWSLAFPEEKVQKFKDVEGVSPPAHGVEKPSPPRPRVHLDLAYRLSGFVQAAEMWHEISMAFNVRLHRYLEVWLAACGSPGPVSIEQEPLAVRVRIWLVQTSAGVRLRVLTAGVFSLLPSLGVGLDTAVADISGGRTAGGRSRRTLLHATGTASLLGRVMFHERAGLGVEIGTQVLFNTSRFCVDGPSGGCREELLDFGRVSVFARLGVVFGL